VAWHQPVGAPHESHFTAAPQSVSVRRIVGAIAPIEDCQQFSVEVKVELLTMPEPGRMVHVE
jgi:hypothetical protein